MTPSQPPRRRGRPPKLRPPVLPRDVTLEVFGSKPMAIVAPGADTRSAEPENQVPTAEPPGLAIPSGWFKGMLLNVRHAGAGYRVTLLGEEYDPRHPERTLEFENGFDCQNWVSAWYAREPGGRPW